MERGYKSRFNCCVPFGIIGGLSTIIGLNLEANPDCPKQAAKASDCIALRAKVIRCS